MVNIADSVRIRQATATLRRDGNCHSTDSPDRCIASAFVILLLPFSLTLLLLCFSAPCRLYFPTPLPLFPSSPLPYLLPYSYFQSGSSGCFMSHSGRALRTSGTVSKLYSGGGEVVAHSSVHASHGSSPACSPLRRDLRIFQARQAIPAIWKR